MRYIGTAGWTIPKKYAESFPKEGTHLERYSQVFNITEINQTFYKLPRSTTFQKWYDATPKDFKFSIKLHRSITHFSKLSDIDSLGNFLNSIKPLNDKLLSILIQLPPSLNFDEEISKNFFENLRKLYKGYVAVEPRNRSWVDADELLKEYKISRVAADPPRFKEDKNPRGWENFCYFRLHGNPKIYYSSYSEDFLLDITKRVKKCKKDSVVIFDNTASGVAIKNALFLKNFLN